MGTGADEASNGGLLRLGVPGARAGQTIGCVVKRLGTASVLGADVGACSKQLPGNAFLIGCCSNVQGGITRVKVMLNVIEVVRHGGLTGCSLTCSLESQFGRSCQQLARARCVLPTIACRSAFSSGSRSPTWIIAVFGRSQGRSAGAIWPASVHRQHPSNLGRSARPLSC